MTTSKVIVTAHVLTYQLWSQIYPGEFYPVYWLYRLQLQTHLVLDPLSTTETRHLPQMYTIHLQRSYCYFHQLLYHLCHCLLTLNGDMLVFEMPDFLGENVHIQKEMFPWTKMITVHILIIEWQLCWVVLNMFVTLYILWKN